MDDTGLRKRKTKKEKKITAKMQIKLLVVFCVFLAALIGLIARIVYISNQDKYKKGALELRSYVTSEVPCKRGDILDRNGNILATGEIVYNLILDPKVALTRTSYTEAVLAALETVYGFNDADLRNILNSKSQSSYVILKKELSYSEKCAFTDYVAALGKEGNNVKGIWFEEGYKRVYPNSTLASHVIGFIDANGKGSYGIEQYYNDVLKGSNGRNYGYYDGTLNIVNTVKEPVDGNTCVSTIDANIQRIIENYTDKFLNEYGAENLGVIVMDANSGEIYGMQSNYSYDLNDPRNMSRLYTAEELALMSDEQQKEALFDMWRNFCVSDAYEPGSMYKPFTVAAALEEACITKDSMWDCDGGEDFPGDVRIKCSNKKGHGHISLVQSIMFSCNDALMQVAKLEGREIFADYQKKFCIGSTTGIDLPGEAAGQSFSVSQLNETELATSSFGQGFTATMVQMASAFSSLINGGTYYEPHIVRKIQSADGTIVKKNDPVAVGKTISESTGEFIKDALYLTVSNGTGTSAKIDGYLIGGKTGTSQKLPRDAEKYLVSFLGFVEDEEMDVVIYIVVDECHDSAKASRCATAMSLFTDIAEEILPYLRLYPEGEINYKLKSVDGKQVVTDPSNTVYDPEYDEGEVNVISR
ncbi:MAG: penicillin-binding protein 2 [Lachnospiraceae bacterium]|nr:penicillin-binding protein 2 [Lachnospiraceae bacterium]